MKHYTRIGRFCFLLLYLAAAITLLSAGSSLALAAECDDPDPNWVFYSCWERTTIGSCNDKDPRCRDNSYWGDWRYGSDGSVVNNAPAGHPEGAANQVLKIHWDAHSDTCSGGSNNFVEELSSLPNPYYMRVYFYSEDPREYTGCGGRKFMYTKNSGGYGVGGGLYLYSAPGNDVQVHIKNHVYEGGTNTSTSEHLDASIAGGWPGQTHDGLIHPDTWHVIEFAVYTHNTNGWIKVWVDGEIAINTEGKFSSYDTNTGYAVNWVQMPSYRNGGIIATHEEYFDNFIISTSYIGPIDYDGVDRAPPVTLLHSPARFSENIATNSNITLHIQDSDSGVDSSSIVMKVNGQVVNPPISGNQYEYTLSYDPPQDFYAGQVVNVEIHAEDLNNPPNVMPTDSYTFVVTSSGFNITGLSPTYSQIGVVSVGETVYIDRDYTLLSGYSSKYEGLTLIKTACDDKNNSSENYLSFAVDDPVSVYVSFEQTTPPSWLSTEFTKTNDTIAREGRTYDIWSKEFPAGTIILGGNSGPGATNATYFLLIEQEDSSPLPPPAPTGLRIVN